MKDISTVARASEKLGASETEILMPKDRQG